MDPATYQRLVSAFDACRAASTEERDAIVSALRAEDRELAAMLEDLLAGPEHTDLPRPEVLDEPSCPVPALGGDPATIGPYRILRRLGAGGMGVVYEGEQDSPRLRVAVKLVRPLAGAEAVRRFQREAEILARLQHPSIARIYASGTFDHGFGAQPYLAMELIDGVDVRTHAARERLSVDARLGLIAAIADAVEHAHQRGIVHRDLKPDNVLVDVEGRVKVLDFGIARLTEASTVLASALTETGQIIGTLAYMAPEQLRGDPDRITSRADVYSLGVLGYELVAGRLPHEVSGLPLAAAANLVLTEDAPDVRRFAPAVDRDVATILSKALEQDPARRYEGAGQLAADLRRYQGRRPITARPPTAAYRARRFAQRHRELVFGMVTTVLVLTTGLVASLVLKAQADANAALAEDRRDGVLRLGAFQVLEDLTREAERLWPPDPALLDEYDDWITRARDLVAGLEPNADDELGYRGQLASLERRALPQSTEEREAERRGHPRYEEWHQAVLELEVLRRAAAVRAGEPPPDATARANEPPPDDPRTLLQWARALVDPERTGFGDEVRGRALARRAVERASDAVTRCEAEAALAWAHFACGEDAAATAAMDRAVEDAPPERREWIAGERGALQEARAGAAERLAELERRTAGLEAELARRRDWRFADEDERWWFNQLGKLVSAIEAFDDPDTGLWKGISAEHGWGIERRRAFAASVAERSLTGADAAARWREALASIHDPVECPAYVGLTLEPQLGLLPLGRDPASGLWEFAHVMSGEPAVRSAEGPLILNEDTGIVLVLLAGGRFWMGAQSTDPTGHNYDERAEAQEGPVHEVLLRPFLVSKYEMTQGQWRRITRNNPSRIRPETYETAWNAFGRPGTLLHPVECVTWVEAVETCGRMDLVLPTEAQWEYAARGGKDTPWWSGEDKESLAGAVNLGDRFSMQFGMSATWGNEEWLDDGYVGHAPVTEYRANPFGLQNILGNVYEWCLDGYEQGYYRRSPVQDPCRPAGDVVYRSVRGGDYAAAVASVRCSFRTYDRPQGSAAQVGLRPARLLHQ